VSDIANLFDASGFELAPGVVARPLFGTAAMLNLLDFEDGAVVPAHDHPHEQLGIVLDGELTMVIGGAEHRLRAGDAYAIAGGVQHSAAADRGPCRVLDVFHPVREDYRELLTAG
jgi:quercetin dioxygenase-like cupin family protein